MSLNLAECLALSAEACPDKTAIVFENLRISYGQLAENARRVAHILRSKGVGQGDVVGMMMPNTPHFPMIYYGILYAGAIAMPLNPMARQRELLYRLRDSGARMLFAWEDNAEEAVAAFNDAASCRHLVMVESAMSPAAPLAGESFLGLMAAADHRFDMAQTRSDDTAVLLYTCAVGQRICAAELTHFNLFQNALCAKEFALGYSPEDVCLTVLPLFHGFGQTAMLNTPILAQSTIVLMPRFETHRIFDAIKNERVTLTAMVPTMYHVMTSHKRHENFDFSSVRVAIAGGSKMPVDISEAFMDRFGVPVLEGYGLTEMSPAVSFNRPESNRLGSMGKPIWGVRAAIMREDGAFALPGETGEIVLRGHNLMKGYFNHPEVTAKAMQGGWFHTRDLGYLDEDGYLHFAGLLKDLIICSGMNVWPHEVEEVLCEHPAVRETAVVGIPEPIRGEEINAFIILEKRAEVSENDLAAFFRERVSAYKCPRKFHFLKELPRDASGKIDKQALRASV
jgi:long-chain acyl-CoA synthetase